MHTLEIRDGANLASRMPLQAKQRVLPIHPEAIIAHRNQPGPARCKLDPNPRRVGVEAILHEFLDEG